MHTLTPLEPMHLLCIRISLGLLRCAAFALKYWCSRLFICFGPLYAFYHDEDCCRDDAIVKSPMQQQRRAKTMRLDIITRKCKIEATKNNNNCSTSQTNSLWQYDACNLTICSNACESFCCFPFECVVMCLWRCTQHNRSKIVEFENKSSRENIRREDPFDGMHVPRMRNSLWIRSIDTPTILAIHTASSRAWMRYYQCDGEH